MDGNRNKLDTALFSKMRLGRGLWLFAAFLDSSQENVEVIGNSTIPTTSKDEICNDSLCN